MMDMGSVFGRYKPVVVACCPFIYCSMDKGVIQVQHDFHVDKGLSYYSEDNYIVMTTSTSQPVSGIDHHCTCIQECPAGHDKQAGWEELVIPNSYPNIQHHQGTRCSMDKTVSKLLKDDSTKREQPSSSSDINNKESDKDDLDDHIQQCKQVGQDELVIAASSYNWYSHDYIHTIVCRYCREEVNSCYYEDHLVSCLESYKRGQGDCLVVDKMVQVTGRQVTGRQVTGRQVTGRQVTGRQVTSKDDLVVNYVAVQETFT